jgi:hypothetical protein
MHSERWAELYPWEVKRLAGTPLFGQIYAQIRSAVLSGALGPERNSRPPGRWRPVWALHEPRWSRQMNNC